jgi:MFS family permease
MYAFMVAGLLITLGDRIGRRRLLLLGAAAFAVASVVAATATSAGVPIAARVAGGHGTQLVVRGAAVATSGARCLSMPAISRSGSATSDRASERRASLAAWGGLVQAGEIGAQVQAQRRLARRRARGEMLAQLVGHPARSSR